MVIPSWFFGPSVGEESRRKPRISKETTNTPRVIDQTVAAIEAFFWPKIFWDFITLALDPAVKPLPILQIVNLIMGIFMFALEWPLPLLAGSGAHRSLEVRLVLLPLTALAAVLIYQGTNAALYYVIGMMVYFWAYSEGEVSSFCSSERFPPA